MGIFTGLVTLPIQELLAADAITVVSVFTWLVGAGLTAIIIALIALLFALLASVAVLRFANTGKFGSAFEFSAVVNKAFKGAFIGGWLITIILSGVIGFILALVPIIGPLVAIYVIGTFSMTALALSTFQHREEALQPTGE